MQSLPSLLIHGWFMFFFLCVYIASSSATWPQAAKDSAACEQDVLCPGPMVLSSLFGSVCLYSVDICGSGNLSTATCDSTRWRQRESQWQCLHCRPLQAINQGGSLNMASVPARVHHVGIVTSLSISFPLQNQSMVRACPPLPKLPPTRISLAESGAGLELAQ